MHVTEPFVIIAQFISGSNNDGLPALTLADHFYLITKAMNKYLRKVLEMLKTNKDIKALGFSRRELKGIAANVADKLKLEEDATDEDVSEAISSAIDDVLPLLKLTQSAVDRQVQDYKRSTEDDDDDDDDGEKEPNRRNPSQKNPKSKKDSDVADSATLAALKELTQVVTALQGEVNTLKTGNTTNSRRAKVEKLLTDTGKFGERQLKAFSRMSFKDEEEFEEYLEDLKEDIEAENQERADRGLGKLGNIPAPDKNQNNKEEELMSDEDVKKLAQM